MPGERILEAEKLTPQSSNAAIRLAISKTIARLITEGKDQKAAAGEAYGIAERQIGRKLGKEA
jgi:hypothetical protein